MKRKYYSSIMDIALDEGDYEWAKEIFKYTTSKDKELPQVIEEQQELYLGPKVEFELAIEASQKGYSLFVKYARCMTLHIGPRQEEIVKSMQDNFDDTEFYVIG